MNHRKALLLIALASIFSPFKGHSIPISSSIGDEPECIFSLAHKVIQASEWSHLILEPTIYYEKKFARQYTIYAHSTTTSPKVFKLKFGARYVSSGVGSCYLTDGAKLFASDGKRAFIAAIGNAEITFNQFSPRDFSLVSQESSKAHPDFEQEKSYEKVLDEGVSAFSGNTKNIIKQSKQAGVDVGGLVARRYLWKPVSSSGKSLSGYAKVARTTTGIFLWSDLITRGFYTLVAKTDPGDVAVFTAASDLGKQVGNMFNEERGAMKVSELAYKKITSTNSTESQRDREGLEAILKELKKIEEKN